MSVSKHERALNGKSNVFIMIPAFPIRALRQVYGEWIGKQTSDTLPSTKLRTGRANGLKRRSPDKRLLNLEMA